MKPLGRQLGKLSHTAPGVVFEYVRIIHGSVDSVVLFLHASLALVTFICTIEQLRTYNFLAIQADVACFLLRAYDDNQN